MANGKRLFRIYLSILFSLWIALCCSIPTYGQQSQIDSLTSLIDLASDPVAKGDLLISLAKLYARKDVAKYRELIDEAQRIPQYSSIKSNAERIAFHYANMHYHLNEYEEAKSDFYDLLENKDLDSTLVSLTNYKLGNLLRKEGRNDKAIQHLLVANDINKKNKDKLSEASVNIVLGIIHKQTRQYPKALEFYSAAFEIYKEYDQKVNMSTCVLNMANVYMRQDSLDKALETYESALELANKTERDADLLAYIYGNLSNLYSEKKDYKNGLDYALQSYEIRKDLAGAKEKLNSLIGIASNQKSLGQMEESMKTIHQALGIADSAEGITQELENLYSLKSKIHKHRDECSAALTSINKYLTYHDSLTDIELDKQALDLNKKYETSQKENEIALLKTQKEKDLIKLNSAKTRNIGLTLGLILFSSLLFWVYKLLQNTKVQNQIISNSLEEKDILLREIHHRVKNNLQFISSLLGLQSEHIDDEKALEALQGGQDRVQSMALIHQNLYQEDNLTGVPVQAYFIKLIQNLFDSYNIRPELIKLELEIDKLNLDVDTVIPLGLILNELVSNSLKYAFPDGRPGVIRVLLFEENSVLNLIVEDTGIGIDEETKKLLGKSFGYRLIHVFKNQLKAELNITSTQGTKVAMGINKYIKQELIQANV